MQISGVSGNSYLQQLQQMLFAKTDSDKSGSLTVEEFTSTGSAGSSGSADSAGAARAEKLFASIDTSGDGEVSGEEFGAYFSRLTADTTSSLLQLQQQDAADRAAGFLSEADADGDGELSLDEFAAAGPDDSSGTDKAEELFGQIDADDDGKLSADELSAFEGTRGPGKAGEMPPPSASEEESDGETSLADLLSGLSGDDDAEATSLADVLASVSEEEDDASGNILSSDFARTIEAYLKQAASDGAERAKPEIFSTDFTA